MQHFYEDIPGWFGFADLYREAVRSFDGVFVEIGAWKGRSAAFLAVEIINSGKPIKLHVVDTFEGSANEPEHENDPELPVLRAVFDRNMEPVRHILTVHQLPSIEAASLFADGSVSLVLIDAAHDDESVKADIAAWRPKVRPGGWLCGDDINWPGVRSAVEGSLFGWEQAGCAWRFIA